MYIIPAHVKDGSTFKLGETTKRYTTINRFEIKFMFQINYN